ncbi:putative effector [Maize bushy stunt phytoplasma]|uniref:Effector n=1 Tax=Maize bushy stunt phytoplasma TaxID=202462 RepID=A0ABM6DLS0_9MOLU|nr:hypothetical protein [Maize bushy stunt phytoplasma]AOF54703.1 putative effector [Maize bushy stunt phytoplasma]
MNPKIPSKKLLAKLIFLNTTLQLYQPDPPPNKKDKYHNPIKTNYKKGLNIIYYRQEDLQYLRFFLTKTKQKGGCAPTNIGEAYWGINGIFKWFHFWGTHHPF